MDVIIEIIKILLPAGLVLYAMYLVVRSFVYKEIQEAKAASETDQQRQLAELQLKKQEVELKNKEQILPIRLQAYERMCLFLERISPAQLIPRLNNQELNVGLMQHLLIQEIRNEFAHNLAQQIYISNDAWLMVRKAMEETILLINNSSLELADEAPGYELSKKILENAHQLGINPTEDSLNFIKDEIRDLF